MYLKHFEPKSLAVSLLIVSSILINDLNAFELVIRTPIHAIIALIFVGAGILIVATVGIIGIKINSSNILTAVRIYIEIISNTFSLT